MQVPKCMQGNEVTMAMLLAEQSSAEAVRPVSSGPRTLVVDGVPVAAIASDPGRLSTLSGSAGPGSPLIELLASLSHRAMQCVLVIESRSGRAMSFAIEQGSLVGAVGSGPRERVGTYAREYRERFGVGSYEGWAALFLEEAFFRTLPLLSVAGARMTVIQGDVQWREPRAPRAMNLQFALMEHARREDEHGSLSNEFKDDAERAYGLSQAGAAESANGDDHARDLIEACLLKSCRAPRSRSWLFEQIPAAPGRVLESLRELVRSGRIVSGPAQTKPPSDEGRVVRLGAPSTGASSQRPAVRPSNPYAYVGRRVDVVRTTLVAPGAEPRTSKRRK